WRQTLVDYAFPVIGNLPVDQIETNDVLAVLRPIWESKCETASRLRGRIERILARATVEGLRRGANPATWRGHLQEACRHRNAGPDDRRNELDSPTDADVPMVADAVNVRLETCDPAIKLPIISKLSAADEATVVAREYAGCALSGRLRSNYLVTAEGTQLQISCACVDLIMAPSSAHVAADVPAGPTN